MREKDLSEGFCLRHINSPFFVFLFFITNFF
nr:MAG TPA: hypothetical protein [Caudoviricetes sp.]